MPTISEIITIAKISQYLIANENAKKDAFQRGGLKSLNPELIYMVRRVVERIYNRNNNYPTLDVAAKYLYWLCGKFTLKTQDIINLGSSGGVVGLTQNMSNSLAWIYEEIEVGAVGSPLQSGDTSYTLSYTNIVRKSVRVELTQANIPQGETNQFSYDPPIYTNSGATINFVNNDGNGNNLGLQDGMLLIFSGARVVPSTASVMPSPITSGPVSKQFTGADLSGDKEYIDEDYSGYDVLVELLGFRPLKRSEYDVIEGGGAKILLEGDFGIESTFQITPNGLYGTQIAGGNSFTPTEIEKLRQLIEAYSTE